MKKKKFPEEEIIAVLKEGDSGIATPELCCKRDIIAAPTTDGSRSMEAQRSVTPRGSGPLRKGIAACAKLKSALRGQEQPMGLDDGY